MSTDNQTSPGGWPVLSIVVPCFNEAANVPELARRLLTTFDALGFAAEALLVDDGSHDGTLRAVRAEAARDARIRPLAHASNRGLFAAWRTGLAEARGDYFGVIDADLQYQPEDLARLLARLAQGDCDVAQGVRVNVREKGGLRFWLSRGFNALLNLAFRMALADNKSGFFLTRRDAALDFLDYGSRYVHPQSFVMVSAHQHGYRIGELRTFFAPREQGASFLGRWPLLAAWVCFVDVLRALPEFRWRRRRIEAVGRALAVAGVDVRRGLPVRAPAEARRWRRYVRAMPVHHWMIGRDAGEYYEQLAQSQWLARPALEELQRTRLAHLVRHAYRHSAFYRQRMDAAGIRPERVQSMADLAELPPLTKDDIRAHLHAGLLADNVQVRDLYPIRTSGSTGNPLLMYVDRPQLEMRWAATLRSQEWTGYRFGDRCARLWHQTIGMSRRQVAQERLDAWLCRRHFEPAWQMRADNLAAVVERLRGHRPVLIDGYAESLDLLARFLAEQPGKFPGLTGLMSSAQTMPGASRARIEAAFGAPVFDKYGAREFSGIAYECAEHQGYHVVAENVIVEIVRDGRPARPGEMGEVWVTDLNNLAMPLLRYRLGDLARAMDDRPCACGRGLPRIGEVLGRTQSIVVGTEGQLVPGSYFAHLLKEYDYAIERFQVVQERVGELELRIVRGGRFSPAVVEQILAQFHERLGASLRIAVRFVDELPLGQTGKFQHSVSRLRFDFQSAQVACAPQECGDDQTGATHDAIGHGAMGHDTAGPDNPAQRQADRWSPPRTGTSKE